MTAVLGLAVVAAVVAVGFVFSVQRAVSAAAVELVAALVPGFVILVLGLVAAVDFGVAAAAVAVVVAAVVAEL